MARLGKLEQKIFRLNDEIATLRRQEELAREELIMHEHLDDDAQRDAAVSESPLDRADAADTRADVERAKSVIDALTRSRQNLERRRDKLLARLR